MDTRCSSDGVHNFILKFVNSHLFLPGLKDSLKRVDQRDACNLGINYDVYKGLRSVSDAEQLIYYNGEIIIIVVIPPTKI